MRRECIMKTETSITQIVKESLRSSEACPTRAFINAQKVSVSKDEVCFSDLEFEGSYCFQDDITHFCIDNYLAEPVWETNSTVSQNYFVGRTELIWNSVPHTKFASEKPHLQINFSTEFLSLEKSKKAIFQIAEENIENIHWLSTLLFEHQKAGNLIQYFNQDYNERFERENIIIDDLWEELKKKHLIFQKKILFPLYLYCISCPDSIDYYKIKSKEFGLIWLTPNVCITTKKKSFNDFLSYTFGNLEVKTQKSRI